MTKAQFARWGAPVTYVSAVIIIGLTLITILVRAPDTRSNYQHAPEGYTRTALATIGEDAEFQGLTPTLGSTPREVYIGAGCASCHGLSGEGGVVGPAIWKKNAEDMLEGLREGEPGMPFFSEHRLSDEQITALAQYLNALQKASAAAIEQ